MTAGGEGRHEDERVQLCVALLGSKCSKYSPLAVTLREYAFTLLRGLSLHALGVAALSEDITEAISVLVHHLGMLVLGDHSPTPTPTSSRRSAAPDVFSTDVVGIQLRVLEDLTPQLADYFTWLVAHKKPFVRQCRALEVLEHVHPALRQSLQREEFFSPEDLLHKYRHKYKPHLARMPLPLQLFQREDIVQVRHARRKLDQACNVMSLALSCKLFICALFFILSVYYLFVYFSHNHYTLFFTSLIHGFMSHKGYERCCARKFHFE